MIVFLLTGVWHGANWTFVAWGAHHGVWLLTERCIGFEDSASSRKPHRRFDERPRSSS